METVTIYYAAGFFIYFLVGVWLAIYWRKIILYQESDNVASNFLFESRLAFWWPLSNLFNQKRPKGFGTKSGKVLYILLIALVWPLKLIHCVGVRLTIIILPFLAFLLVYFVDYILSLIIFRGKESLFDKKIYQRPKSNTQIHSAP